VFCEQRDRMFLWKKSPSGLRNSPKNVAQLMCCSI
jgi:hypothetical protein